jgi:hypothetical protein
VRSEPQCAWDSFLLAPSVLEASTRGTDFRLDRVSMPLVEVGVERSTPKGGMLETVLPQERTPWRRGRPSKNMGKREEDYPQFKMSIHPTAEGSTTLTYRSRLMGTASKGSRERKGRAKELDSPVKSSIQQLEQAQLAIA